MLTLIIVTIVLISGFVGVAWYARYRSEQRSKEFALKTRVTEPTVDNDFGQHLDEQIERQEQYISSDTNVDASLLNDDPNVTLSSNAIAEVDKLSSNNTGSTTPKQDKRMAQQQVELDLIPPSELSISPAVTTQDVDTIQRSAEPLTEKTTTAKPNKPTSKGKEWDIVLALTILSAEGTVFTGADIQAALAFNDITPGEMQIYHRYLTGKTGQTLFSVANLLAPGTLKPDEISSIETKGLVVFMRLPSPANGLLTFDAMLDAADKIAKQLNGKLGDEKRQALTETTLEAMRSRILNFNLSRQADNNQFNYDYSQ